MKIKELEDMLRKKDEEIKAVKQKRFEELEVVSPQSLYSH